MGAMRWICVASIAAAALVAIAHADAVAGSGQTLLAGVDTSLDHTAVDFGDPVTATVTVTAPRDAEIHVEQDPAPLTQLGETRAGPVGGAERQTVTYAARGSCLDDRCIAASGDRRLTLRPATVTIG